MDGMVSQLLDYLYVNAEPTYDLISNRLWAVHKEVRQQIIHTMKK